MEIITTGHFPELGGALASHRCAKHMAQKTLARRLGISENYMCMLENGRRVPSQGLLGRWVRALGCAIEYKIRTSE